jgi:hypothetical protein
MMLDVTRVANFKDLRALVERRLPSFIFNNIDTGSGDGEAVCRQDAGEPSANAYNWPRPDSRLDEMSELKLSFDS